MEQMLGDIAENSIIMSIGEVVELFIIPDVSEFTAEVEMEGYPVNFEPV